MAIVVSTTFTEIIAYPVARLQSVVTTIQSQYIFYSFASDEALAKFRIDQDQVIVLRPKTIPADAGCQAGGGRNTFRLDPTLSVSIWNRLWIDQAGQDSAWTTDASYGIAPLIDSVSSALEQYMPTNAAGNYLLIQPMRLMPGGWQFPMKVIDKWGVVTADYFFPYQMTLS